MAPLLAQRSRVDRSFERLYRRHVSDVYHYALAVLRNPADAEDVTQTAFLNAYNAFRRGERPKAPRNWLIAIAHNVCRQRFRQSARRPQEVAFDEDVADALVEDDVPTAQDIRAALGHLAFNQRAALVMRELEGRSYAEIGDILGLTVGAVETLIFRARRALREQLEGSLTCQQAELALSRQLDGRLPRSERGALRAHLRACPECASFARSQRAQRAALRSIAAIPLPGSLASFFGGGAAAGTGLAIKAAAVVAAGAVVTGVGYEGVKRLPARDGSSRAAQTATEVAARTTPARAEIVRATSSGVRAAPEKTTARSRPAAKKSVASRKLSTRAGGAAQKSRPAKPVASRGKGRPAALPAKANTRTTASRGKSTRARVAPQPARAKPKAKAVRAKPPKAASSGRPEQPGKSEPPPKKSDSPLPVPPPAVPVPALPPTPPPPALPDTGKR